MMPVKLYILKFPNDIWGLYICSRCFMSMMYRAPEIGLDHTTFQVSNTCYVIFAHTHDSTVAMQVKSSDVGLDHPPSVTVGCSNSFHCRYVWVCFTFPNIPVTFRLSAEVV